jgi:hypothetical protein
VRDYGYDWKFAPWFAINPDLGLFVGGGPILYRHGYRSDPYIYRMQLRAGFATVPQKGKVDYLGEFTSVVPGALFRTSALFSQIEVLNFYGAGNETTRGDSLYDADYYKARQLQVVLASSVVVRTGRAGTLDFGLGFKHVRPTLTSGTLVADTAPLGLSQEVWYFSLDTRWTGDWRDAATSPRSGILASVGLSAVKPFWSGYRTFERLSADFRWYVTPLDGPVTLALRAGGEKIWGTFPYYESAFLGGSANLPGFEAQRFAGDGSLYAAAEARLALSSFMLLVPIDMGVTGVGGTGRVFVSGETSSKWHGTAGGGLWFSFIDEQNVLSVSVITSAERTGVYIAGGFSF